jgi:threonyl-tRNA synthetase
MQYRGCRRLFFLAVGSATHADSHSVDAQIEQEINGALDFVRGIYGKFGFTFSLKLSTRPEHYMGDIELWNQAEAVCGSLVTTVLQIVSQNHAAFFDDRLPAIAVSRPCA